MGYLGQEASFTGTQNNQRLSTTAAGGQINFSVGGGYSINALDVYRNGIKLSGGRDFRALDGVTVTLLSPANDGDIIEFVTFENFKREDVITGDGDATIRGNVTISGDLGITGSLNATVSNTATAGFATVSGISSALGIGATAVGLNASGIITAISFSGSGANLTGIAATDDVSTNSLVVAGISTLAGATFSGVSTFFNNVELPSGQHLILGDGLDDSGNFKLYNGANEPFEIFGSSKETYIRNAGSNANGISISANGSVTLGGGGTGSFSVHADNDGTAKLYGSGLQKLRTDPGGVIITGIATADGFSVGDNEYIRAGVSSDIVLYHDDTNSFIENQTGAFFIDQNVDDSDINIRCDNGSGGKTTYIQADGSTGAVKLHHYGTQKFETTVGGINVGVGITMDGNGIAVSGILTCNGVAVGQNAIGARTVQSGGSPSGGSNGDIYYIY